MRSEMQMHGIRGDCNPETQDEFSFQSFLCRYVSSGERIRATPSLLHTGAAHIAHACNSRACSPHRAAPARPGTEGSRP